MSYESLKERKKEVGKCPHCRTPYYAIVYYNKDGNDVFGSLANTECVYCGYGLISGKPIDKQRGGRSK